MRPTAVVKRFVLLVVVLVALCIGLVLASFLWRTPFIPKVYLAEPPLSQPLLQKMRDSRVSNMHEVLAERGLLEKGQSKGKQRSGVLVASPYMPAANMTIDDCETNVHCNYFSTQQGLHSPQYPARADVMQWWESRVQNADAAPVCAVAFDNAEKTSYRLKTFANVEALAEQPTYQLTHYQACGACSTLQDLAVYAELDLTNMASKCSKIMGSEKRLQCMQEGIGFTPACAQVWSHNAERSARYCKAACIKQYGVWALLTDGEKRSDSMSLETDACLYCDAMVSEPGFQYAAGRSRRNSGIESEIVRDASEVYAVQHDYWAAQLQD